jgi:hypothetical protein
MLLLLYKFKKLKKMSVFVFFWGLATFSADVVEKLHFGPLPTLSSTRHIQHWSIPMAYKHFETSMNLKERIDTMLFEELLGLLL